MNGKFIIRKEKSSLLISLRQIVTVTANSLNPWLYPNCVFSLIYNLVSCIQSLPCLYCYIVAYIQM